MEIFAKYFLILTTFAFTIVYAHYIKSDTTNKIQWQGRIVEGTSTQKYEITYYKKSSSVINKIKLDEKAGKATNTQKYEIPNYKKSNGTTNKKRWEAKIVGGTNAQRYEFPFLVSYQTVNGEHFCGGTILTAEWILIAAHCLYVMKPYETRVVAGMLNQNEAHTDIQIVDVFEQIIHPNYPGGSEAAPHDIGLLHLTWPLYWTYAVLPISLPFANEENYGYAWTAGWGYESSSNPVTPTRLQKTEMYLISYSQCANDLLSLVGSIGPLNQNMICGRGAYTGTESICKGDSGGPLIQNGKVIGVTSWTLEPCGHYNVPSVYTKVSKYLAFIRYYVPNV